MALYQEIDAYLETQHQYALASGNPALTDRIETKQRMNDQAYFLLCWGQLEAEIDEVCRRAIRKRVAKTSWPDRRAWDLYNPDDRRLSGLSFVDRVCLVADKQAGSGSSFARIVSFYELRNQIAHGRLRPDRIDVTAVAGEFYTLRASLAT